MAFFINLMPALINSLDSKAESSESSSLWNETSESFVAKDGSRSSGVVISSASSVSCPKPQLLCCAIASMSDDSTICFDWGKTMFFFFFRLLLLILVPFVSESSSRRETNILSGVLSLSTIFCFCSLRYVVWSDDTVYYSLRYGEN